MELSPIATALLGLLLAAWAFAAAALIIAARGRVRQARAARATARRLARMIENSPVIPLLVRSDGALEGPERLAAWLGLENLPQFLSELRSEDGGLEDGELEHLRQEVRRTLKTAAPFRLSVTPRGSRRSLAVCGQHADRLIAPEGAALVWWFDHTDSEEELAGLRSEMALLRGDFAALMRLIEAAPIPMWFRGPDLSLRIVNRAYAQAVGIEDAASVVLEQIELLEPIDGRSPAEMAGAVRDRGQSAERIVPATIGGQRRMLRVCDLPLGEQGVAGFAIEVEEQQAQGRALKALEEAQRALLQRLPVGVAVFDFQRRLALANPPFHRLFSLAAPDEGGPIDFHGFLERARAAGRLPESGDFAAWRRDLGEWFGAQGPVEHTWKLRDGKHLRVVGLPMPAGGLVMLAEDRTEHIAYSAERNVLLRSRAAIFDSLGEALAIFTPEGRVETWNRRFGELWQLPEDQPDGRDGAEDLLAVIANRLKPAAAAAIAEAVRAATLERRVERGRIRMSDQRLLDFTAVPLPDGKGLLTLRDMTGAEAAEAVRRERDAALVAAEADKAAFLADVAAQVRSGLLAIGGSAEALREGAEEPLPPSAGVHVSAILAAAAELEARLDSLLDQTPPEAGAEPLTRAEVEVLPLLTAVVREREPAVEARSLTLNLTGAKRSGSVSADERQLARAIGSLLDDAIAAAPRGGRIDVTLSRLRDLVTIEIAGQVASPRPEDTLGERSRSSAASTGDPASLKRARRVIEAHGGRLTLRSGPVGTRVATITLA